MAVLGARGVRGADDGHRPRPEEAVEVEVAELGGPAGDVRLDFLTQCQKLARSFLQDPRRLGRNG